MKKLLLITVLLVLATTKIMAQNKKTIEIKKNETNQFKIVANEEVDINLKFDLQKGDVFNVFILDEGKNIIFSKEYQNEGESSIAFTMEDKEEYLVKFTSIKRQNFVFSAFAKN